MSKPEKEISGYHDEIKGIVNYHYEYYSRFLKNERDIIVWLPESYSEGSKRYPVLYMHDGQNLFNPATSFIGYDWKVDETITELIEKNTIREIIVVGIYNSHDRINEYNYFTDRGRAYANFIVNELKPFIDDEYRTFTGPINTAVMGSSMGGLISFQLIWNYPGIFGKAACLSNSFWINDKYVFEMIKEKQPNPENVRIYLDCGTEEKELFEDNKMMFDRLMELGFTDKRNLFWHEEPEGQHSEYHWAKRLFIPISVLFGRHTL